MKGKGKQVYVDELGTMQLDEVASPEVLRSGLERKHHSEKIVEIYLEKLRTAGPEVVNGVRMGFEDLCKANGHDPAYLQLVCDHLEELWKIKQTAAVLYFYLELLRWMEPDKIKLDMLLSKLVDSPKDQPDRQMWAKLKTLTRLKPRKLDMAVWLADVINEAGTVMAEELMNYRDQFEDDQLIGYFFTEIAKLGSIESLIRFAGLMHFFRDRHEDVIRSIEPIMIMIHTGQKTSAMMAITALDEAYTTPAKLPKLEIN